MNTFNDRMTYANQVASLLRLAKCKGISAHRVKNTGFHLEHLLLVQYLSFIDEMHVEVALTRKELRLVKVISRASDKIAGSEREFLLALFAAFTMGKFQKKSIECEIKTVCTEAAFQGDKLDPFIYDLFNRFIEVLQIQGVKAEMCFTRSSVSRLPGPIVKKLMQLAPLFYLRGKELQKFYSEAKARLFVLHYLRDATTSHS